MHEDCNCFLFCFGLRAGGPGYNMVTLLGCTVMFYLQYMPLWYCDDDIVFFFKCLLWCKHHVPQNCLVSLKQFFFKFLEKGWIGGKLDHNIRTVSRVSMLCFLSCRLLSQTWFPILFLSRALVSREHLAQFHYFDHIFVCAFHFLFESVNLKVFWRPIRVVTNAYLMPQEQPLRAQIE